MVRYHRSVGYIERPVAPPKTAGWAYVFLIAGSIGTFASLMFLWVALAFATGEPAAQAGITLIVLIPLSCYVAAVVG